MRSTAAVVHGIKDRMALEPRLLTDCACIFQEALLNIRWRNLLRLYLTEAAQGLVQAHDQKEVILGQI